MKSNLRTIAIVEAIIILLMMAYNFYLMHANVVSAEIIQGKDRIIEGYREITEDKINFIDSLQHLRNENDTINYNIPADSLERIFSERYSSDRD